MDIYIYIHIIFGLAEVKKTIVELQNLTIKKPGKITIWLLKYIFWLLDHHVLMVKSSFLMLALNDALTNDININ